MKKRVLITGAAGNLGGLLARHLLKDEMLLHLLVHCKDVSQELKTKDNVNVFRADLAGEFEGCFEWGRYYRSFCRGAFQA